MLDPIDLPGDINCRLIGNTMRRHCIAFHKVALPYGLVGSAKGVTVRIRRSKIVKRGFIFDSKYLRERHSIHSNKLALQDKFRPGVAPQPQGDTIAPYLLTALEDDPLLLARAPLCSCRRHGTRPPCRSADLPRPATRKSRILGQQDSRIA